MTRDALLQLITKWRTLARTYEDQRMRLRNDSFNRPTIADFEARCEVARACANELESLLAALTLAGETREDSLGLSIDMLDADRLRQWASNLDTHGADISHWASVPFVAGKLRAMADAIEEAVRDIQQLRQPAPAGETPATEPPELWRELLWFRHGCPVTALYGDDGQMQCSQCGIDFKTWTPQQIRSRWRQINNRLMAQVPRGETPAEPTTEPR